MKIVNDDADRVEKELAAQNIEVIRRPYEPDARLLAHTAVGFLLGPRPGSQVTLYEDERGRVRYYAVARPDPEVVELKEQVKAISDAGAEPQKLNELRQTVDELAGMRDRIERIPEIEKKLDVVGTLEKKVDSLGQLEKKIDRLGELETRVKEVGELHAKVEKLATLETKVTELERLQRAPTRPEREPSG